MLYDYSSFLIFCFSTVLFTNFMVFLGDAFFEAQPDFEKNSSYECGFQPFDFNIQQFDVKYYIVALLFLVFDVEIAFIIPFVNMLHSLNIYIYFNFLFFFYLLILGFIYEWKKNYLDWE